METMQWLTLVIFAVTILVVVTNVIDSTLAGMIGVAVMIWAGVMSEDDAFKYVDWNVMAILVEHLADRRLFREIRRAELAFGAGAQALGRASGAAGDDPDLPRRRDFDVRRQRGHHPDDGAGGPAAGARDEASRWCR